MRRCIFSISLLMLYNITLSQTHSGVEQYYYASHNGLLTIVPKAYYQDKKNWYAEVRYNYDELETFSLNVGKKFSKEGIVSYSITPIAGIMAGKLTGASLGVDFESDYRKIFFSAESQYAFSADSKSTDFFFNWSEAGYQLSDKMYTGLALQLTHLYKTINKWEPGIMAGFIFKKWTFPLYVFNPLSSNRYFVLGINIEWKGLKVEKDKIEMPLLSKTEMALH